MLDPIVLYSPDGKTTKSIPAIDAAGWINAGWATSPVLPPKSPSKSTKSVAKNGGISIPENPNS